MVMENGDSVSKYDCYSEIYSYLPKTLFQFLPKIQQLPYDLHIWIQYRLVSNWIIVALHLGFSYGILLEIRK